MAMPRAPSRPGFWANVSLRNDSAAVDEAAAAARFMPLSRDPECSDVCAGMCEKDAPVFAELARLMD